MALVVTGASGFLGQHVVARLQNSTLDFPELRLVDRQPFHQTLDFPSRIPMKTFTIDLCSELDLEGVLVGAVAVIHLAAAPFCFSQETKRLRDEYHRDNLRATETLVDKMLEKGVKSLVHVGDAYANLPVEDNYGFSEDIHQGIPRNFFTGAYGETRIRAELYARAAAEKGALSGIFLRPVWLYGEGERLFTGLVEHLVETAGGVLRLTEGRRRGIHQFMYVGNMAGVVEKALGAVLSKSCNEVVFSLENTAARPFTEYLVSLAESAGVRVEWQGFYSALASVLWGQLLSAVDGKRRLSVAAFRLLFDKAIGFSNKRQRLFLDYSPQFQLKSETPSTSFEVEKTAVVDA